MKPTEALSGDHRDIERMISVLESACAGIETGKGAPLADLEAMLRFIREFADGLHHAKEEDLLFPALEEAGLPRDQGPVGVMLMEHDMGRAHVKGMAQAAAKAKAGDKEALSAFAESGRAYAGLLRQHIYKEDNILFRMAEMHLSPEKLSELARKFDEAEARAGAVERVELLSLIGPLEKTYLK
ncbi:MAG: hemerythrin domain-containing protein [Chloroflexota bacterium]